MLRGVADLGVGSAVVADGAVLRVAGRITVSDTAPIILDGDGALCILEATAVLVALTLDPCIINAATAPTVINYGAWANTAEDAGIILQGDPINVGAFVQ